MLIHNRLTQHVSGIIMLIVRRTDYKTVGGVSLDVLAVVVWSRDMSWAHCVKVGALSAERTNIHTLRSARVPTPHNRSQHIQANTTHSFIQSVLLTMGIMMPKTCWV